MSFRGNLVLLSFALVACGADDDGARGGGAGSGSGGAPSGAPEIESLIGRVGDDGAVAVELEGRAGVAQPRTIRIELLDAAGTVLEQTSGWASWLARPNRAAGVGSAGRLVRTGDRFSGFMSYRNTKLTARPARVSVSVADIEEVAGEPVEVALEPPEPVSVAEGSVCDPFELLDRCDGGALCDAPDGGGRVAPTCVVPEATCPLALPGLQGGTEDSNADSPDDTYASCTSSRGNVGNEQGYSFLATDSGSHRFLVEEMDYGAATTLFVRRYCNLGHATASELACRHVTEVADGEPFDLTLDLTAGETVFVFVEAYWANGGRYRLSVEAPP